VILYLHDLRQFPARLHHVRVRARLTVKTIAVASASAVPQKKAPSAAIFGVGFAFPNYDVAWKAMDGDLGAYCRGLSETVGLYCMDKAFDHGFREITMKSKPINMPDDLKGVKIRLPVAPLFIALFQHFGASPTPINFGEVYSALQTGLVDGQENPLIRSAPRISGRSSMNSPQRLGLMSEPSDSDSPSQIAGALRPFNNPPPCWRCPRARLEHIRLLAGLDLRNRRRSAGGLLILCSCTGAGSGNLSACRFSGRQFRDSLTDRADAEFRFGVVEVKRRCAA
jgi:Bacterial extracellular solute-binding protein, family 7